MQFLYRDTCGLDEEEVSKTVDSLDEYRKHLQAVIKKGGYDSNESSVNLPSDTKNISLVKSAALKVKTNRLKYIIDIGIGGSNLGTKAVYDALHGFFDHVEPDRYPKMFFADTVNPAFLTGLSAFLKEKVKHAEEVVVNIISKSGSTTETVVNAEIVIRALSQLTGLEKRIIITTDEGSKLEEAAKAKKYFVLYLPKLVGGRYSVMSAVGLFPLAVAGIDIDGLTRGALVARDNLQGSLLSAVILYLQYTKGKTINDNFFFHGELESLGKWYRQLMGESIGKDEKGITPIVSIGSTDLHSVAQLYYGGPKDKMTTFVRAAVTKKDITVPSPVSFTGLVEHIDAKPVSSVMSAIEQGVKISYGNEDMPFTELVLEEISTHELGFYMQFKMIEMMFLGKLLKVNAFDQPHVELYKTEMKKILSGK